jgi:agmatine deiminase
MQWPADARHYGHPKILAAMQDAVAMIAREISRFEPVVLLAGARHAEPARAATDGRADIWPIETDDLWCRDSGPTFVRNGTGELAIVDFHFNGWGGKADAPADALVASAVARHMNLPLFDAGLVGEGGGFDVDGAGLAVAHESSWINPNRNLADKRVVDARLRAALGCEEVLWAPGRRGLDITDDHIDAVARFVEPGVAVIQLPERRDGDPWAVSGYATYDALKAWRGANGERLTIEIVAAPRWRKMRCRRDGMVASYANFYVCNGAVFCAEFGDDKADADACALLARLYPQREIRALDIDPLCVAGGGIHCATKQEPRAAPPP